MRISPANLAVPDPAEGRVGNVGQALSPANPPANSPANFTVLDYVGAVPISTPG